MAGTLIVSQDTASELLEAYASLAAWHFQLSDALRAAGGTVAPPSEAQRLAFLKQCSQTWPELAAVAGSIPHPRPYAPPPAFVAPEPAGDAPAAAPAQTDAAPLAQAQPAWTPEPRAQAPSPALAPPPIVDPTKVKY